MFRDNSGRAPKARIKYPGRPAVQWWIRAISVEGSE